MNLLRPLRGIVATMVTWAAAFAVVGLIVLVPVFALKDLPPFDLSAFLRFAINSARQWALAGATMGAVFAAAVLVGERKHSLVTTSPRRFAMWGFLGGASVPLAMAVGYALTSRMSPGDNLLGGALFVGICGGVGAGLAVLSLRVARRPSRASDKAGIVRAPVI